MKVAWSDKSKFILHHMDVQLYVRSQEIHVTRDRDVSIGSVAF